jgi:hypothetical protein
MELKMNNEYNGFKVSIDKFLSENFTGITVVCDPTEIPEVEPDEWISVIYGDCDIVSIVRKGEISFHCLAKNDDGGFRRAKLIDLLIEKLTKDENQEDGLRRIPFYVVENGSLVQKSSILASDTFIDGHYRLTADITGQTVRIEFIWS